MKIVGIVLLVLLAGCEGTWATPMQVDMHAVGGSRITGIALARVAKEHMSAAVPRRYMADAVSVGSDVDAQFQQLRDPEPYALVVERGTCGHPGLRVARFVLYANPDPGEGIEGTGHLDVPIHQLMKYGYSIALLDVHRGVIVSCGDLRTDRPF